jgi:hypothetical protein
MFQLNQMERDEVVTNCGQIFWNGLNACGISNNKSESRPGFPEAA